MPNDLAARALSADAGVSRADYFDAALTQPIPDGDARGRHDVALPAAGCLGGPDRSERQGDVRQRGDRRLRVRRLPGLNVGVRYIHRDIPRVLEDVQPFPDRRVRPRSPGHAVVDYSLTNPGPATRGAGRSRRGVREADPPLQRRRGHRRQAALEPLGAPGVVPLLAAARHLRRVLSATTTGSRIRGSRRCSTSRPTIRATRRSACRSSATAATSASSARSAQARCRSIVRTRSRCSATTVRHGAERGCGPDGVVRQAADRAGGESGLQQPRRDSGDGARRGLRHDRRVPDPDADPVRHRHPRGLPAAASAATSTSSLLADVFNLFNRQIPLDYDPNTETTFRS